jgi:hypothetical protein
VSLPRELVTSSSSTSLTLWRTKRTQPHWRHQSSRFAAVVCIAATALLSSGLNGKAATLVADQPLPIRSVFDDLLAKCFEFFAPPPGPPVGPPPPLGPEPIPDFPLIPGPLSPPLVVIPPIDFGPGPIPGPEPVPVPGPVAGAGVPALMLLGALAWFRRRKTQGAEKAVPAGA